MAECSYAGGVSFKPDGKHDLDPCVYETEEIYRNVTVEILRCKKCGKVEISWYRQDDTEKDGDDVG